jgi:hypothetical protein
MISRGRQAVPHVVVHLVDYFNQAPWGVAGDPEKLWTVAELSAEFFNAFNIQNYGPPGATTTGVAGAGQVTSNVLPPRRDAVWSALRRLMILCPCCPKLACAMAARSSMRGEGRPVARTRVLNRLSRARQFHFYR